MPRKVFLTTVKLREVGTSLIITIPTIAAEAFLNTGVSELDVFLRYEKGIPIVVLTPAKGENNGRRTTARSIT